MSLATRVLCGFLWSAACVNELPEQSNDGGWGAAGAMASPVLSSVGPASAAPQTPAKPAAAAPATTPASSGTTAQSTQGAAGTAAASGNAAGAPAPTKPAATSGSGGAGGSRAAAPSAGSVAPPVANGGAAGAAPLPDLGEILPPLSTPETRTPSPSNPAECPATAPENPIGDCLGLPVYLECSYGSYFCVCDWYHWLCAG